MKIYFKSICKENKKEVLNLRLLPNQKNYIETIGQCLYEAEHEKRWNTLGIYNEDDLIGFAMYGYFSEENFPTGRLWLDRFLIDRRFQGKGYGREALKEILKYLADKYPMQKEVYLSVVKENKHAVKLYSRFGFCFNGEKDIHGEDVMMKNIDN